MNTSLSTFILLLILGCSVPENQTEQNLYQEVFNLTSIEGNPKNLATPFVTAGDRVYLVGHQDGSFPDLGWHVTGEMGGLWDHPIKLMDGFTANVKTQGDELFCLDKAEKFINYPMANRHHFSWTKENIEIDRTQFIPDGVEGAIVEFGFFNKGTERKELTFAFTGIIDLRPTWLGERTQMIDAEDEITFDEKISAVIAKDKNNPWYAIFGSSLVPDKFSTEPSRCGPVQRNGLGKEATLTYAIEIEASSEISVSFFIAGSYDSEESLRANYQVLRTQGKEKLTKKIERYQKLKEASNLTIPDKNIAQMYEWLKYNVDWLKRNVPEQGIGLSAGFPDYPWWFGGDAVYSLQGVLATGDHELAKNTILLLHNVSELTNGNGRIIHEVSTNGSVYNPGNVNETAQFVTLVYMYYAWTGDKELVIKLFPHLKKGMNWVLKERDPDGNLYPNGSGMMEIPGLESELEMIDVAAYTQQALVSGAELARAVGDTRTAVEYQKLADSIKIKINNEWWLPDENSFGDFRGTLAEAKPILEAALIRSDTLGKSWAVDELKETQKRMKKYVANKKMPHVIYHNWVVNTPLETGVADQAKGKLALKKAKTYENPFGSYVTGIDRTDLPDSVVLKSRKKTFSYTGAVMTLPTGVQAVSAAKYGEPDESLNYIKKLAQSFSYVLPGSMYEVSPDFGMFTQAWNIYGVAVPIVNHFFGIQPKAYEKSVSISPRLPKEWKDVAITHVKIGDNTLSMAISIKNDSKEYHIQQTRVDWTILVDITNAKRILLNDQEIDLATITNNTLTLTGLESKVRIY